MGVKITRDGNIIKASGWPAGSIVGFVFGILFLIVGILTIFANTTVSLVIIILSNIILYASRRHGNGARNRKLAEEVEKEIVIKYGAELIQKVKTPEIIKELAEAYIQLNNETK
ncbi:MAG TPA: hypothetical protein VK566_07405 [Nitrososphaeraceae archaeon]|nr:hypothetical protein [Nitrososphaeraceae archaeon]